MKIKFNKKTMKKLSLALSIVMLGVFTTSPNVIGESFELELDLENSNDLSEETQDYTNYDYDYNHNESSGEEAEVEIKKETETTKEIEFETNYDSDDYYESEDYDYGIEYEESKYEEEDGYNLEDDYDYNYDYGLDDNLYEDYEEHIEEDYNHSQDYEDYNYNYYDNYSDYDNYYDNFNYSNIYDDYNNSYDDFFYSDNFEYEDFGSDLDWGYGEYEKEEHIPGENFLKTPKTIQYTKDTTSKYPTFIDTGIKVEEDDTVDIEGLKELFRQISVKENIKIVEDINRVMVLANGKVDIVIGRITKVEELEEILENMDITLKSQDTRAGGKFNLADYLEYKKEVIVEVNGEGIKLLIDPRISNSRVLFPIRSIGEAMGADVSWDTEKAEATLKKDDKEIILSADSDVVIINEKEYLISQETNLDKKEERLFSLIGLIVEEFDGEMSWNSNKLVLEIVSPQDIVDLDKYL